MTKKIVLSYPQLRLTAQEFGFPIGKVENLFLEPFAARFEISSEKNRAIGEREKLREIAEIKVEGQNKWLTLIQNASVSSLEQNL